MSLNSEFLCPILSLGMLWDLFSKHCRIAQGILTVSAKDWGTSQEKSIRIEADDVGSRLEHEEKLIPLMVSEIRRTNQLKW